jgi:phosphatidylglycerol lysyltransferase
VRGNSGSGNDGMTSRPVDRLALAATAVIFCAAIVVLAREFDDVSLRGLLAYFAALPAHQILAAAALTAASYLLLTGYDFLALRYVRRRVPVRSVLFASFTAFVFSNNLGFQLLSGGSFRYRIYAGFGIDAVAIGEIVAFCTVAYALGVIAVGGALATFDPGAFAALLHLPRPLIFAAGLVMLAVIAGYLALAAIWREPVALGSYRLRPPSLPLALSQVALASFDAVLVSTVLYALLPADFGMRFESYLCTYIIAATVSVLSLVPGGLGVFETAVTLTLLPAKAATLGLLFVYRVIYFVIPLAVGMVGFAAHEIRRRAGKRQAAGVQP